MCVGHMHSQEMSTELESRIETSCSVRSSAFGFRRMKTDVFGGLHHEYHLLKETA